MKRSLTTIALLAVSLALSGCVDDYGGRYGGVYSAGAYPYSGYYDGGYYDGYGYGGYGYSAYPGGYYRGNSYHRGAYPRGGNYRGQPGRPAPRADWNGHRNGNDGAIRGNGSVREPGQGGWNERNNNWSRNPAGTGGNVGRGLSGRAPPGRR